MAITNYRNWLECFTPIKSVCITCGFKLALDNEFYFKQARNQDFAKEGVLQFKVKSFFFENVSIEYLAKQTYATLAYHKRSQLELVAGGRLDL